MSFLTPWTAALAAGLAVPSLLLLYFLKLRRREMPISSTLLWKKAIQDLQVNAPFQKLRRNLLLFLQLAILGLAIAALASPITKWTQHKKGKIILLIDQSGSMNATEEGGRTRLDLAKQTAADYLTRLADGDEAMVIAFADRAHVVCPFTADRAALRRRIETIEPTDARSTLGEAIRLAMAYSSPGRLPESNITVQMGPAALIELFSDGRIADAESQIVQRGQWQYFPIGKAVDNAGIVALDVRRAYEKPNMLTVFAQVENFGPAPIKSDVSLYLDGRRLGVKEVSLGPATPDSFSPRATGSASRPMDSPSAHAVVFELEHDAGGVLEVVLHRTDALATDNVARAPIDPPKPLQVLLVSDRPWVVGILDRVLHGMPIAKIDSLSTDEYEAAPDAAFIAEGRPKYDVTLLDNHSTAKLPPGGYLFFGGAPRIEGVSLGDKVEDDQIVSWDETHPLLRYVSFANVFVAAWRTLKLPAYAVPLVEAERSTVMAYLATPGRQFVVSAFDLADSNWPLRVPFVVFLYNATRFLSSAGVGEQARILRPGDTLLAPPMKAAAVTVERPDGGTEKLEVAANQPPAYAGTQHVGLYTLRGGKDETFRAAVNLLDRNESRIAPREGFSVGAETVTRGDKVERVNQPVWPWLIFAALAILMFEWWVYNRRVML